MLENEDIQEYQALVKKMEAANRERESLQTEVKVYVKQGKEILQKYGYSSFSDIAKLKEKLDETEKKVLKEKEEMEKYCTYMAEKKEEKARIFSKEA